MRWKNSYGPHADGTDRGNPRDAGAAYACQRVLVRLSFTGIIFIHIEEYKDYNKARAFKKDSDTTSQK